MAASDICTSSSTDSAKQDTLSKEPRRRRPPHRVAIAASPSSPHGPEPPRTPPVRAPPPALPPGPSRHPPRRDLTEKLPPRKLFRLRRARGCAVPGPARPTLGPGKQRGPLLRDSLGPAKLRGSKISFPGAKAAGTGTPPCPLRPPGSPGCQRGACKPCGAE